MKIPKFFSLGFQRMIPIAPGVVPFGAVMGTVASEAKLSLFQTMSMNTLVYAGAAQLASVELMTQHAASVVVVLTGLVINLRFILYSVALAPVLQSSMPITKFLSAYSLTDQSYAVVSANQSFLKTNSDVIEFYLGTAFCMLLIWQLSVLAGFVFGNFAPASWALDYAVPLSFVALVIPTLKNKTYVAVAAFSSVVSVVLNGLPYRSGLVVTAILSILFGALISGRHRRD